MQLLSYFTKGKFWSIKCLVLTIMATVLFTSTPALFVKQVPPLSPAYDLKADNPFADTTLLTIPKHAGERSHGAKLTPRIVGALAIYWSRQLSLNLYTPATLGGLLVLLAGILMGNNISGDRATGLFIGFTLAGLYVAADCFSINWNPKPFDGVALGFVALAIILLHHRLPLMIVAMLGCLTDERVLLSLVLIALLVHVMPANDQKWKRERYWSLSLGIVLAIIVRMTLSVIMHWGKTDVGLIGPEIILKTVPLIQLTLWTCFEGAWLAVILAIITLAKACKTNLLYLFVGSIFLSLFSCLLVLDISRASSFVFPIVFIAFAILASERMEQQAMRKLAGTCAVLSLLVPNFEIIATIVVRWLPPIYA